MELDEKQLISVIVPVYNVEKYLRQCLNSVVGQTYKNLEIIVVDDGSTDGSGTICDEYTKDKRIKVFHTENKGLSAARNLGLDHATGDWIGFVDSDDWIEPDMYEVLLNKAIETGADVVECGFYREYKKTIEESHRNNRIFDSSQSIESLLRGEISNAVWNKLWKNNCYINIRFPLERIHEDVATIYKVFLESKRICTAPVCKYHYIKREGSISNLHNMKNLVDYWHAVKERLELLWDIVDEEAQHELLKYCALAVARTWAYYLDNSIADRLNYKEVICEMNCFTIQHFPIFGEKSWDIRLRIGTFFPHFQSNSSFRFAWTINHLGKKRKSNRLKG